MNKTDKKGNEYKEYSVMFKHNRTHNGRKISLMLIK